jgi:hypothetical protein
VLIQLLDAPASRLEDGAVYMRRGQHADTRAVDLKILTVEGL